MADTTSTHTDASAAQDEPKPSPPPAREAAGVEDTDWRAEAIKWEKRAKENFEARKRLDELEESQKSEAEKAADRLRQAQEEAQQARADAARFRIAAEHRLSPEDAELLTGDEEAMTRLAARLAAANASGPRSPRPDPNQGRAGDGVLSAEDHFVAFAKKH